MAPKIITGYPQMPSLTQDEIEIFLSRPLIARLGTINEDGTIHIAPIYFKYEKGEFILGTQKVSRRVRNIKRNPKVTLLIDDPTPPFKAVLVYGQAELEYDDVVQKRITIFEQFDTKEEAIQTAEGICNKWPSVVIRLKPDRIVSFDYSKASLL
ncbi:MAG: pyridoxamine 5'-phosphate oxidase family protein [Chloroflexi bacterium]|nr:pyridoxamine 5'-phosphate oxidase family protein [Chloroflexota bacterium]